MSEEDITVLSGVRLFWGMFLIILCILLVLSFYSYDWQDISILHVPPNKPPSNLIGPVGAWMSFSLLILFGIGAYFTPLWCLAAGILLLMSREKVLWHRIVASLVMLLSLVAVISLVNGLENVCTQLNIDKASGIFGKLIVEGIFIRWLSKVGTGIVISAFFVISFIVMVRIANFIKAYGFIKNNIIGLSERIRIARLERQDRREQIEYEQKELDRQRKRLERSMLRGGKSIVSQAVEPVTVEKRRESELNEKRSVLRTAQPEAVVEKEYSIPSTKREEKISQPIVQPRKISSVVSAGTLEKAAVSEDKSKQPEIPAVSSSAEQKTAYTLPDISLLHLPEASEDTDLSTDAETASRILIETLNEFGIEVTLKNIESGPTVTRYELEPAPGVRVERIGALSNNLALSLKSASVRVQAPVPGKGVVGIEVPNSTMKKVYLREILEGETWRSGKAKLPLALGKDVGGSDLVADLTEMPHLLVAGATGSGKTVCINSILAGLLMSQPPSRLKLLLVDPKIVEFSVYNNIPHLVVPVVTDPKKVAIALRWAINEMEKRYKLFARVGVRNIQSFNERPKAVQTDLFIGDEGGGKGDGKGTESIPDTVPYIVIVIDELADLMLVDQAEIENCIARLAQLSRAVGIHMILSTQRPSVNVITGTIKANFPARIAFQVAQKVDSRTILDTIGAEKLLGRGDMLFLPPGASKMIRAQGALTTDEDIRRITDFIRTQATPSYELEIKEKLEKSQSMVDDGEESDELISQAIEIIRETNRASTSLLQRRLRIGYTRAARIMDILEERGIVGPPRGSDPREILVDLDTDVFDNNADNEDQDGVDIEEGADDETGR